MQIFFFFSKGKKKKEWLEFVATASRRENQLKSLKFILRSMEIYNYSSDFSMVFIFLYKEKRKLDFWDVKIDFHRASIRFTHRSSPNFTNNQKATTTNDKRKKARDTQKFRLLSNVQEETNKRLLTCSDFGYTLERFDKQTSLPVAHVKWE